MNLRKTYIVTTSLLGVYSTVRRYQKKRRPVRAKHKGALPHQTNKYLELTQSQVKEEFKKRIAAGECLSQDEYTK